MFTTPMTTVRSADRPLARAVLAGVLIVGAAACSGDDDAADDSAESAAEAEAEAAAEAAAEEAAAEVDELTERAEAAEASLADTEAELADTAEQLAGTQEELAAETARADETQAALDTLGGQFPIVIDSALDGLPLAGTYSLDWAEAYCDTFSTCGQLPARPQVSIAETPEGWLEMVVPDLFTVALFAVQGSLYGITDSEQILPPCGDAPQVGKVAVTLYADGVTVLEDGTRTVDRLGASVTVTGSLQPGCPGGTVFYGVELTPVA